MRNLLLAILSLLVAALGTEVLLRTTHLFHARVAWTEPDPLIGYRFTPGSSYWFLRENDHPIEGRINAMGWRDRERTLRKPPGTFRAAVIGDSFVEAFQVELDSTFEAIAERDLNGAADGAQPRAEVMNFGRSGMTTSEELIVLERDVLPCAPDAVVVVFVPQNDVADIAPRTASTDLRPFYRLAGDSLRLDATFAESAGYRRRERLNGVKQRSALVSLVAQRYNLWRLARAAPVGPADVEENGAVPLSRVLSLCTAAPDSTFLAGYALNKRLLQEMARVCRAHRIPMFLMSVPVAYTPRALEAAAAADSTFDPGFFDADLGALADTTGVRYIPLTAAFERRAASGERLNWAHWSYAGHRLVGRMLAGALAPVRAPEQAPE